MFRNLSSQKFEFVDTLKNIITPNSILLEQNLDLFLQFQQNISLYLGEVLLWDLSQEDDLLLANHYNKMISSLTFNTVAGNRTIVECHWQHSSCFISFFVVESMQKLLFIQSLWRIKSAEEMNIYITNFVGQKFQNYNADLCTTVIANQNEIHFLCKHLEEIRDIHFSFLYMPKPGPS